MKNEITVTSTQKKTVTIRVRGYFCENECVWLRVKAIKMDEMEATQSGASHMAKLSEYQIGRLNRELTNGPAGVNVTKVSKDGKAIEAEVYFNQ